MLAGCTLILNVVLHTMLHVILDHGAMMHIMLKFDSLTKM